MFSEETVEGTYIAARFLLQETLHLDRSIPDPLGEDKGAICYSQTKKDEAQYFLPANLAPNFTIPDYKAPFWAVPPDCQNGYEGTVDKTKPTDADCSPYFRPATWISVLGRGNFYPIAAFSKTIKSSNTTPHNTIEPVAPLAEPRFKVPVGMKMCLFIIFVFAVFHIACCWTASFTAKPAFRAHFAATSNWFQYGSWQHPVLITTGSVLIAFIALVAAWKCGAFGNSALSLWHTLWIWCFLIVVVLITLASVVASQQAVQRLEKHNFDKQGQTRSCFSLNWRSCFTLDWQSASLKWSVVLFLAAVLIFIFIVVVPVQATLTFRNRIPTYWRSMSLNSGVSPLVPFLSLFVGLYIWFRYSLHGLALFGRDRPQLPLKQSLRLEKEENGDGVLVMFSQERAEATEKAAIPLHDCTLKLTGFLFVVFAVVACWIARAVPVRSLGANLYTAVFCVFLDFYISLTLAEAWQLCRVWRKLKQLLSFLDRLALRRTMSVLQGFSWGNVWRMSGNVLDVRYKLLSRQIETLAHMKASFTNSPAMAACNPEIKAAQDAMKRFAKAYSRGYSHPISPISKVCRTFREKSLHSAAGCSARFSSPRGKRKPNRSSKEKRGSLTIRLVGMFRAFCCRFQSAFVMPRN